MNKRINIYIAYILCILLQPIFFVIDVLCYFAHGVVEASAIAKRELYWNHRKLRSELKLLDYK